MVGLGKVVGGGDVWAAWRSVLVPVTLVSRVAVAVVEVVHMVSVGHGVVATARTVLVPVVLVDGVAFEGALVPVAIVSAVGVAIVEVVHVVTVLNRGVAAVRSVLVRVVLMHLMFNCHDDHATMIAIMRNQEIHLRKAGASGDRGAAEAVHPEAVMRAQEMLLDRDLYRDLATMFGALSDPARASIVHLLAHQELCTADLALTLGFHRPAVSQHLRLLRQLRLVRSRREGRVVLYSLDDAHVAEVLTCGMDHVREYSR